MEETGLKLFDICEAFDFLTGRFVKAPAESTENLPEISSFKRIEPFKRIKNRTINKKTENKF